MPKLVRFINLDDTKTERKTPAGCIMISVLATGTTQISNNANPQESFRLTDNTYTIDYAGDDGLEPITVKVLSGSCIISYLL